MHRLLDDLFTQTYQSTTFLNAVEERTQTLLEKKYKTQKEFLKKELDERVNKLKSEYDEKMKELEEEYTKEKLRMDETSITRNREDKAKWLQGEMDGQARGELNKDNEKVPSPPMVGKQKKGSFFSRDNMTFGAP